MTLNGTMANSSKKRKASELDSDFSNRVPKPKNRRKSKGTKQEAKNADEIPFRSECPYKPSTQSKDDAFVQQEEIAPGFEFEYAVRPGSQWKNMRSYRNVKLQDHTFSVGTVIYINKQNPPPKSPHPDATDEEVLRYDRSNFWVGRIADTRAESEKAVYLRVYWLYWPEELPMGRQPYHGERELILSNAMDIVDAQTISGAADLTYWEEKDPSNQYQDRFWRQTFDVSRLGKDKKGGLSELRRHCKCHQPHNPDKTMFQCKKPSCKTWNHEECIIEDVLVHAWSRYEKSGTLDGFESIEAKLEVKDEESSLRDRLLTPVRHLGKMMQGKITPAVDTVVDQAIPHQVGKSSNGVLPTPKKSKPVKKSARSSSHTNLPGEGKLKVTIINTNDKDDDSPIFAKVEEVVGKKSKPEPSSWRIHLNCLVCGHAM